MDMIKKIALIGSVMLFVLAQFVSCYVIFASQKEKINLLVEKEGRMFLGCVSQFNIELNGLQYGEDMQDHVLTYCFRENMPEYSALYKGEEELYNGSSYTFDVGSVDFSEHKIPCFYQLEKVNGRHILVFCEKSLAESKKKYSRVFFIEVGSEDGRTVFGDGFTVTGTVMSDYNITHAIIAVDAITGIAVDVIWPDPNPFDGVTPSM